jgi:hypothetical protein
VKITNFENSNFINKKNYIKEKRRKQMDRIRQSYDGLKSMVTNVIAFVAGANDDPSNSSLSSGEIVECDSDCSQCCPENQSISMNDSSRQEAGQLEMHSCRSSKEESISQRSKRRKQNSDEDEKSNGDNKENEMIDIANGSKRKSFQASKSLNGGSKRGKNVSLFLTSFIVSFVLGNSQKKEASGAKGTSNNPNVIVVHRKRKFDEISNTQLNRTQAYQSTSNLNKSANLDG